MLNIQLNEGYRITSDQYNVILAERYYTDPTKRPGFNAEEDDPTPKEKWREIAFCRDVAQALSKYVDHCVKHSDATTLQELRTIIVGFQDEVRALYGTHKKEAL